jgi:hypothetical protein
MYYRANHTVPTAGAMLCVGNLNPDAGDCHDTKKQPITDVPFGEYTAMYTTFALVLILIVLILSSRAKSS